LQLTDKVLLKFDFGSSLLSEYVVVSVRAQPGVFKGAEASPPTLARSKFKKR